MKITSADWLANVAVVDALDDRAVDEYLDSVEKQAGQVEVVLDATGLLAIQYANGKMAVELTIADFMVPTEAVLVKTTQRAGGE